MRNQADPLVLIGDTNFSPLTPAGDCRLTDSLSSALETVGPRLRTPLKGESRAPIGCYAGAPSGDWATWKESS
jgi:hypothetical protein